MILLLAALLVPVPQDDPWETHLYSVEFLSREVEDRPGRALGLHHDAIGVMVAKTELALFLRARAKLLAK